MQFNFIEFFRSLSYGGLLGCGVAGVIYLLFYRTFEGVVSINTFVAFGGLIGAGAQQLIESVIRIALPPISSFISYYEKMIELSFLLHRGRITPEQHKEILSKLTQERFLGKRPNEQKLFPPD